MTDEEMFQQLTELPPSKREQCLLTNAMDSEQRKRVVALLAAHEQPDSLLAADDMPSTIQGSSRVVPGVSIGPYKLREQIGEGGMGVVYIAEQNQPVKRKVALKLRWRNTRQINGLSIWMEPAMKTAISGIGSNNFLKRIARATAFWTSNLLPWTNVWRKRPVLRSDLSNCCRKSAKVALELSTWLSKPSPYVARWPSRS